MKDWRPAMMNGLEASDVRFGGEGRIERRGKRRFPIAQEVRYRLLYGQRIAETGVGRTMNMSSSGIWLTTETILSPGLPVELSLTWPALLNDICPIKLVVYGCVVRSNETGAAVAVERYEFRTQGSKAMQQQQQQAMTGDLARFATP